jgi:septal ring factor EnvC (AmiA/AmiB activator)
VPSARASLSLTLPTTAQTHPPAHPPAIHTLRAQSELAQREADVSKAYTEHMVVKQTLTQKNQALSQVQTAVAHSKAEIAQLMSDIEKAKREKQDALKLKEEAIMRAVQFGVQGENSTHHITQWPRRILLLLSDVQK